MSLIVQKFGGTSVKDLDRIRAVAQRVKQTRDAGHQVIVVVSARSGLTNELIEKAKALNATPDERELDMLLAIGEQETTALMAIALHAIGVPAVSQTGFQAGIETESIHTRARIVDIKGGRIREELDAGKVVIVAGFQGIDRQGNITTLGRGGSDLTAIALASFFRADRCQIYTDVDGVYTADPRVVPDARKIIEVSYDEMLEMASLGSKVMQARSVEFAKKFGVVFEVLSSFNNNPGTIVKEEVPSMEEVVVRGLAVDKDQAKVTVSNIADKPGSAAKIFRALSSERIVVDMIVQNIGRGGYANLSFTVPRVDSKKAERAVSSLLEQLGGGQVAVFENIAKLSVVGVGMRSHSGVASTLFQALADAGVNIEIISTSEIKISVVIDLDRSDEAARAVHAAFKLAGPVPA
jgi:aspartate kinase